MSPLLDKVKASKEKFAFILSVSSLQLILLIPIATAYLGYMITLIANNIKDIGISENAYLIVVKSVIWNFFSWAMILIALGVTFFGLWFGKLKVGRLKDEHQEFTKAHIEKEELAARNVDEYPGKARNLLHHRIIVGNLGPHDAFSGYVFNKIRRKYRYNGWNRLGRQRLPM